MESVSKVSDSLEREERKAILMGAGSFSGFCWSFLVDCLGRFLRCWSRF